MKYTDPLALLAASMELLAEASEILADATPLHSHAPEITGTWIARRVLWFNAVHNLSNQVKSRVDAMNVADLPKGDREQKPSEIIGESL